MVPGALSFSPDGQVFTPKVTIEEKEGKLTGVYDSVEVREYDLTEVEIEDGKLEFEVTLGFDGNEPRPNSKVGHVVRAIQANSNTTSPVSPEKRSSLANVFKPKRPVRQKSNHQTRSSTIRASPVSCEGPGFAILME
ncbi:MAG: hypothetical protein R3B91_04325 [Planctomycetaceae bacterium]